MLGLLLKDLYTIKRQYKVIGIIGVIYLAMAYTSENPSVMVSVMVIVALMMPLTCIAYEERCKWNAYANALPLSKSIQVGEKYLFPILLAIAGSVIMLGLSYVLICVKDMEYSFGVLLKGTVIILSIGMIIIAVMLPSVYKFGVEKARLVIFTLGAIGGLGIVALQNWVEKSKTEANMPEVLKNISVYTDKNELLVIACLICISLALYTLSFFISLGIEKKKEY